MSPNKPHENQHTNKRPNNSEDGVKTTNSAKPGGWLQFLKLIFFGPFIWLARLVMRQPLTPPLPPPEEPVKPIADSEATGAEVKAELPLPELEFELEPEAEPEPELAPEFSPPAVAEQPSAAPEPTPEPVPESTPELRPAPEVPVEKLSFVQRVRAGLNRGNSWLTTDLRDLFADGVDEDVLEDLETQLLMADVGVEASEFLIDKLRADIKTMDKPSAENVVAALRTEMAKLIVPCSQPLVIPADHDGPFVLLIVGVNGVGKTTTIGKLAHYFRGQGHSVMLAAGDTFRAAAVEQLQVWGERNDIPVVAQHTGADSASVIYDALESAKARNIDVLIADTAGRLHTQDNLMDELKKVRRVLGKLDDTAPHETMLVVDGGTGQNALSQAKLFNQAVSLTGLTVTKLDGTAKGGVMFALARQQSIPIRFIGVGEAREDLGVFNADEFVSTLFPST